MVWEEEQKCRQNTAVARAADESSPGGGGGIKDQKRGKTTVEHITLADLVLTTPYHEVFAVIVRQRQLKSEVVNNDVLHKGGTALPKQMVYCPYALC